MGCKLSIKILLIVCLQVLSNFSVFSQERKFDIDVDHGTIADVFNFIEDQSDYNIFYKVGQIDVSREISLHATGVSITRILDLVISQFNASYVIHGDMIVITPLKPNKKPEK